VTRNVSGDVPLYEHLSTFLGLPPAAEFTDSTADVIVQGIPFDITTSGRPGTRFGPQAIRLISSNLKWDSPRWPWDFELGDVLAVEDAGDVYGQAGIPDSMVDLVETKTDAILSAGKRTLTFGGDHYVALPLLRSHFRRHGKLSLLHFDAHTDTYKSPHYDYGSMFYHAVEEGLIDPDHSVQVGIRTAYDKVDHRFTVLDADWVANNGPAATLQAIKDVIGDRQAYLSFDIDGLDPAYAPGTGTPVVGGLTTNLALQVLRGLVDQRILGMDLVEVSPPYDHMETTALAAATLALEMLYVWAEQKRRGLW
jgi:agmatinase